MITWIDIIVIVLLVSWFPCLFCILAIQYKTEKKYGVTGFPVEWEACEQAKRMLINFLCDSIRRDKREYGEGSVGCTGFFTLWNSPDCTKLLEIIHCSGCRMVLRRKSNDDIEVKENTKERFNEINKRMKLTRYKNRGNKKV